MRQLKGIAGICFDMDRYASIWFDSDHYRPVQARKLAKWLPDAADFVEKHNLEVIEKIYKSRLTNKIKK